MHAQGYFACSQIMHGYLISFKYELLFFNLYLAKEAGQRKAHRTVVIENGMRLQYINNIAPINLLYQIKMTCILCINYNIKIFIILSKGCSTRHGCQAFRASIYYCSYCEVLAIYN